MHSQADGVVVHTETVGIREEWDGQGGERDQWGQLLELAGGREVGIGMTQETSSWKLSGSVYMSHWNQV